MGDLVLMARSSSLEMWLAKFRCPFFVGTVTLRTPSVTSAHPVVVVESTRRRRDETMVPARTATPNRRAPDRIAFPIHKVQAAFPSTITIGRTANNDVVIPDVEVSKLHAYIRVGADGVLGITDAGSSNGTIVNDESLPPQTSQPLRVGDRVRFGTLALRVVDATFAHRHLRGE